MANLPAKVASALEKELTLMGHKGGLITASEELIEKARRRLSGDDMINVTPTRPKELGPGRTETEDTLFTSTATQDMEATPLRDKFSGKQKAAAGAAALGAGAIGLNSLTDKVPQEMAAKATEPADTESVSKEANPTSPETKKPEDVAALRPDFAAFRKRLSAIKGDIAPEDKALIEEKQTKLDELRKLAQDSYKEGKDRTAMGELASTFGQALTMLGAGLHGMRTGVDMSGTKFSTPDWSKNYDRLADELKTQLREVEAGEGRLSSEKESLQRAAQREAERSQDIEARKFFSDEEAYQREKADVRREDRELKKAKIAANARIKAAAVRAGELAAKGDEKQAQAFSNLIGTLEMLDKGGLGAKDKARMKAKLPQLMGQAGLDEDTITELMSKEEGMFFKGLDYKGMREALTQGGTAKSTGGGRDPKIEEYAATYNLPYEQAKSVLVKRGYKPQE